VDLIQHALARLPHSVSFTTACPPRPPHPHAATAYHAHTLPPMLKGGLLVRTRSRMPPMPVLGGGRRLPLPADPRSEEECPHLEEDAGCHRLCTHARKRSARPWPPPTCPSRCRRLVVSHRQPSSSSLPLGRHHCLVIRSPPPPNGRLAPVREEL
jgi:hypothetical protein